MRYLTGAALAVAVVAVSYGVHDGRWWAHMLLVIGCAILGAIGSLLHALVEGQRDQAYLSRDLAATMKKLAEEVARRG